jgi:hypothetical protein
VLVNDSLSAHRLFFPRSLSGAKAFASISSDSSTGRLEKTPVEKVYADVCKLQAAIRRLRANDPSLTVLG